MGRSYAALNFDQKGKLRPDGDVYPTIALLSLAVKTQLVRVYRFVKHKYLQAFDIKIEKT